MRKVKGFEEASRLLTRRSSWESIATPPHLAARLRESFGRELSLQQAVEHIIDEVRSRGDRALLDLTARLDGVELDSVEVGGQEIAAAYDRVDEELVAALNLAARRIRDFHMACEVKPGTQSVNSRLARLIRPLERAGLYAPGGTAAYPSTVLMMAVPAGVAGVEQTMLASPPAKDGAVPAPTLVAADIAGITRTFKIGGAQAIAAMALGTESVPRVDKVCGPGNIFVTLAKKALYGSVAIDGLEGPSEIVVVADAQADPSYCAADLLAQAEHDPLAAVALITDSAGLLEQVDAELEIQLSRLERRAVARDAVEAGVLALVDSVAEAVELANLFAPEHLSLMLVDAASWVPQIRNAGCIFVGKDSPVAIGDYVAGPSHVLPTGGSARFASPLGVEDFLKVSNIISLDEAGLRELGPTATTLARAEGLDAHARTIEIRLR